MSTVPITVVELPLFLMMVYATAIASLLKLAQLDLQCIASRGNVPKTQARST